MQAEAHSILQDLLDEAADLQSGNLYERIRARFAALGDIDLEPPVREPAREPPHFT